MPPPWALSRQNTSSGDRTASTSRDPMFTYSGHTITGFGARERLHCPRSSGGHKCNPPIDKLLNGYGLSTRCSSLGGCTKASCYGMYVEAIEWRHQEARHCKSCPPKLVLEAHWSSWLPVRVLNRDKWGPWPWETRHLGKPSWHDAHVAGMAKRCVPLSVPVVGHLDRRMGDMEA